MAWPKGMKRAGHVNKNGSVHAKRGALLKRRITSTRAKALPQRAVEQVVEGGAWFRKEWTSLLAHKNGPWTVLCPACSFPEAEGGYCPACGWSKPVVMGRAA